MTEIVSKTICPITHKSVTELTNPVVGTDGYTYESAAIKKWLDDHGTSPMTRKPMNSEDLIVNRALGANDTVVEDEEAEIITLMLAGSLDTSISMSSEASIVSSTGVRESHGLTQLDIAKHALVTVVHAMTADQMFGLVTFSTAATTVLPMTRMNAEGKKKALAVLKTINVEGSTNIWEGIRQASRLVDSPLTLLVNNTSSSSSSASQVSSPQPKRCVWLLTDGQPTYNPPKSHMEMIRDYNKEFGSDRTIRTFGIGENIDSELLEAIAEVGRDSFAYIPDPGFVGTIIVHALANTNAFPLEPESKEDTASREQFVDCLQAVLHAGSQPMSRYGGRGNATEEQVKTALGIYNVYLQVLEQQKGDLRFHEEEIKLACGSATAWTRWGAHYIRAIRMGHISRECTNFKDPSVQMFEHIRGPGWTTLRDNAHNLFINLPAPTPSKSRKRSYSASSGSQRYAAPATMRTYSQRDSGCLHEDARVLLHGGKLVKCKDIEVGMRVITYGASGNITRSDTVECIVKTKRVGPSPFVQLVNKEKDTVLNITKWHPIIDNNTWVYPVSTGAPIIVLPSEYVYSFLLKNRSPAMIIENYHCIALASNCETNEVSSHDFWGTENVVKALQTQPGFSEGTVILNSRDFKRNQEGDVIGIITRQ
jgi:hypothetical protein